MRSSALHRSTVKSDVLRYIMEHGFGPGEVLPTIQEIGKELSVSVAKVRESLEVARTLGLVDVKPGLGTRVKTYNFTPAMILSALYAVNQSGEYFTHLGQVRNALEVYFWEEAVSQLRPDDIRTLRDLIRVAKEKLGSDPIQVPAAEHRAFHLTFFKRLDNPFVLGVLEAFWEAYEAFGLNLYVELDYHRTVWEYHARIVNAVENGAIERGRELLIEHMNLLRDRQTGEAPRKGQ
jgi:DNA-binding FadR family transcriptional regulator